LQFYVSAKNPKVCSPPLLSNENNMVRTLSSACRLQHWDPGSPSSRVPAFLLARSKINLLRLADASGARG